MGVGVLLGELNEDQQRAISLLREIILVRTGAEISPHVLADFIQSHWGTVSALAHIIHGSDPEKGQPKRGMSISDSGGTKQTDAEIASVT